VVPTGLPSRTFGPFLDFFCAVWILFLVLFRYFLIQLYMVDYAVLLQRDAHSAKRGIAIVRRPSASVCLKR